MNSIITDADGRRIQLRRVGVLETLRLYKALGAELSINTAYVDLALTGLTASAIDDVPIPFPINEAGVEGVLERLGESGVEAILLNETSVTLPELVADAGN